MRYDRFVKPSVLQRAASAVRAALGRSEPRKDDAYGLLRGMWPSGIGEAPTMGSRERVAAYADMPWAFALADKVAGSLAVVQWTLSATRRRGERAYRHKLYQRADYGERRRIRRGLKARGELVTVDSHPFLDLLDAGNGLITGIAVRKLIGLYWDLEGEVFLVKQRNALGVPAALWPLPPDWVRSTPTPSASSYQVSFRGWQGRIPETEVLWMKNHNPSNPYARGTGLVRAIADELETDEYAARSMRMVYLNTMRPDFLVYPVGDTTMSESERVRLQQDWEQQHQGFWRAFRARFASKELGVYEFGAPDFRKMEMTKLREFERDLVRQVWGVPPEVMGIVAPGASRSTIDRASYLYSRWVLQPRLELIRAIWQERVIPEFDDRLVLDYVTPVEEDFEFALKVAEVAPWSRNIDEWRAMQDLDPIESGQGGLYAVPVRVVLQEMKPTPPPAKEPAEEDVDERMLERLTDEELTELRALRSKMDGR